MFLRVGNRFINASHVTFAVFEEGLPGRPALLEVDLLDGNNITFRGADAEALLAYLDFAATNVARWQIVHEDAARRMKERDERCHTGEHDYEAGEICVNCLHRKGEAA